VWASWVHSRTRISTLALAYDLKNSTVILASKKSTYATGFCLASRVMGAKERKREEAVSEYSLAIFLTCTTGYKRRDQESTLAVLKDVLVFPTLW
jgi:hypothetical protein